MATQFANGKTTTSGLVFMYDTTDKENCYKGEPTTNLVDYSEYQYLADNYTAALGGWDTFEGSFLIDAINKVPGYTNRSIKMTSVQANVYKYHFEVSLTSGQTYTVSFWGKAQAPGNYGNFLLGSGPSGYLVFEPGGYSSLSTEFTRFKYTFVAPASGTYSFATYLYGDSQVVWLSGFQLENKSHATQYLPSNGAATTRSATEGLKDLMVTNQIDLSNVSFDANAQIIFDGTDDTLDTGIALTELPALSNFSIECIVKIDSYPTAATPNGYGNTTKCGVLLGATYYCGTALYWYGNASGNACTIYAYIRGNDGYRTAGEYNLTPGQYHHLVLVNDYTNSAINLYANGVLNGTYAGPTQEYNSGLTPSAGNIGISKAQVDGGGEAVYSYFNGQIPVAKIYKKSLTASEVTQNYNAIKTRFNLA